MYFSKPGGNNGPEQEEEPSVEEEDALDLFCLIKGLNLLDIGNGERGGFWLFVFWIGLFCVGLFCWSCVWLDFGFGWWVGVLFF